jgi:hypothetical protein
MSVAITFCDQTERECRDNEDDDSFFRWSEAESVPHFIEAKAPDLFQLAKVFKINSDIDPCAMLNQKDRRLTQAPLQRTRIERP